MTYLPSFSLEINADTFLTFYQSELKGYSLLYVLGDAKYLIALSNYEKFITIERDDDGLSSLSSIFYDS